MRRRTTGVLLSLIGLAAASIVSAGSSRIEAADERAGTLAPPAVHDTVDQKGRYKQDGNVCNWVADDDGPNQCTPMIAGRFTRGERNVCRWDGDSRGADECRPATGRWKADGEKCSWNATDDGPDQCNPRKPR